MEVYEYRIVKIEKGLFLTEYKTAPYGVWHEVKDKKFKTYDDEDPSFDDDFEYRIKPEPNYRPFKDAEECWAEMLKHESFGWVKSTLFKDLALVQRVTTLYVEINRDIIDYKDTLEKFTFADGTPFGVKIEEK